MLKLTLWDAALIQMCPGLHNATLTLRAMVCVSCQFRLPTELSCFLHGRLLQRITENNLSFILSSFVLEVIDLG